jgi:uncharacterized membrane protein (DUF485 family)
MAEPTSQPIDDPIHALTDTPAEVYNRRLGLWMFALYLALYVAFVGIIFVDYRIMAKQVFAGLNLAIVYGFGLIIAAFVLALIYFVACKREDESPMRTDSHG